MSKNPGNLTDNQVRLGLSIIDRACLLPAYRQFPASQRWAECIELVNAIIRDPLISADTAPIEDLRAVRDYFTTKHGEALARRD